MLPDHRNGILLPPGFGQCVAIGLAFCFLRWLWPFRPWRRRRRTSPWRGPPPEIGNPLCFVCRPTEFPPAIFISYRAITIDIATPVHGVRSVAMKSRLSRRGPIKSAGRPSSGPRSPGRWRTAPCRRLVKSIARRPGRLQLSPDPFEQQRPQFRHPLKRLRGLRDVADNEAVINGHRELTPCCIENQNAALLP